MEGSVDREITMETHPPIRTARTVRWSSDDPLIPVTITYSAPMNAEELAEFEAFIEIWMRGLRRSALRVNGEGAAPK
jgi:hypothetical protein